jgi:hypothetical protein
MFPELNFLTIILFALLVGVVIFVGRELELRYPKYADYAKDAPSTILQQFRAGAFVILDYASEVVFPGSRENALTYKREKAQSVKTNNNRDQAGGAAANNGAK